MADTENCDEEERETGVSTTPNLDECTLGQFLEIFPDSRLADEVDRLKRKYELLGTWIAGRCGNDAAAEAEATVEEIMGKH